MIAFILTIILTTLFSSEVFANSHTRKVESERRVYIGVGGQCPNPKMVVCQLRK